MVIEGAWREMHSRGVHTASVETRAAHDLLRRCGTNVGGSQPRDGTQLRRLRCAGPPSRQPAVAGPTAVGAALRPWRPDVSRRDRLARRTVGEGVRHRALSQGRKFTTSRSTSSGASDITQWLASGRYSMVMFGT